MIKDNEVEIVKQQSGRGLNYKVEEIYENDENNTI